MKGMSTTNANEIKYLSPKSEEWQSIKPISDEESAKSKARQNQEELNQQLLSAMQMQNLVVLAGCGKHELTEYFVHQLLIVFLKILTMRH
ncbi:MAG TPA: hypothetical protein VHO70_05255 [Chitinispirillaceae bacterium]|nr:hypothetical protein [Chitinispirillaceae bacterium]